MSVVQSRRRACAAQARRWRRAGRGCISHRQTQSRLLLIARERRYASNRSRARSDRRLGTPRHLDRRRRNGEAGQSRRPRRARAPEGWHRPPLRASRSRDARASLNAATTAQCSKAANDFTAPPRPQRVQPEGSIFGSYKSLAKIRRSVLSFCWCQKKPRPERQARMSMDEEKPRRRQTQFTRVARTKRILERLREGWAYDEVAAEEQLTERRVPPDRHAIPQRARGGFTRRARPYADRSARPGNAGRERRPAITAGAEARRAGDLIGPERGPNFWRRWKPVTL